MPTFNNDCWYLILHLNGSQGCSNPTYHNNGKCMKNCKEARSCEGFRLRVVYHKLQACENADFITTLWKLKNEYNVDVKNVDTLKRTIGKVFESEVREFLDMEKRCNPIWYIYLALWVASLKKQHLSNKNIVFECPEVYFRSKNNYEYREAVMGSYLRVKYLIEYAGELEKGIKYVLSNNLLYYLKEGLEQYIKNKVGKREFLK